MAGIWAKVDALLRWNPKCRRAGFMATTVFVDLVLLNKAHNCGGLVPASLAAPEYLADWMRLAPFLADLGTDPEAAPGIVRDALKRCVAEKLLAWREDGVRLVGWTEEWDRETSTSRTRRFRARRKAAESQAGTAGTAGTEVVFPGVPGTPGVPRNDGTVEETRLEETRLEEDPSLREGRARAHVDPPAPKKSKPKKLTNPQILKKWTEEAGHLWDQQELLRAEAIPRSRPLTPNPDRLLLVSQRLEEGNTVDDCMAVLKDYASDARVKPESAKWFNGETNWRPKNFARTLGMAGAPKTDNGQSDITRGRAPVSDWSDEPAGEVDLEVVDQ